MVPLDLGFDAPSSPHSAADSISFAPERAAGLARLETFASRAGRAYARERNYDRGPDDRRHVSCLSPYLRRRLLLESEVVRRVLADHSPSAAEKYVQEVLWRTYFKGWLELRPAVWHDYLRQVDAERDALVDAAERRRAYEAAIEGRTGIECFDFWSRELVQTGYVHNHARMWFASIWIFTLGLPWSLGADFFYRHLLDGDPASNTLSWRWVAGLHTKGKCYAARPSNIAKFTDGRFDPSGQLVTDIEPLEESKSFGRQSLRPLPEPTAGPATGILVHPEDLSIERSALARVEAKALAGGVCAEIPERHRFAPAVTAFDRAALDDGLSRAAEVLGVDATRLDAERFVEHAAEWAADAGLERVLTFRPAVGPWRPVIDAVRAALDERGIALVLAERPWDRDLHPHATGGYFRFKKAIPELLGRLDAYD